MHTVRTLKYPLSVFWEVTPLCNHNCIHCFNYWRSDTEKAEDLKVSSSAVSPGEISAKIKELHPVTVVVTGGEPLLVWEKLRGEIESLLEDGIRVTMNTNAALVTKEIAEFLSKNRISILVSFPCADEAVNDLITDTKGSYQRIRKGLSILKDTGVSFSCNMVVSTRNLSYVEATAECLVKEFGIKKLSLSRVGKPVNADPSFDEWTLGDKEIRELIEKTVLIHDKYGVDVDASSPYPVCALESDAEFALLGGKRLCSAGKTSLVIGSDGSVKACPRDSYVYGNILSEPFQGIWERMGEWRTDELYPEECRECKSFSSCRGACRADALADTGSCKGMDRAAKPERLPLSFRKKKMPLPEYGMEKRFSLAQDVQIIEEAEGFRISRWGQHAIVTEKAMRFLKEHPDFSGEELTEVVDPKETDAVIYRLLSSGIIHSSGV